MTAVLDRIRPKASLEIHRFASALAVAVVALIAAGGLVEAQAAGPEQPSGSIVAYRWLAAAVAVLTVVLAVWIGREDSRAWCRRAAWVAVATVPFPLFLGWRQGLVEPLSVALGLAVLVQAYLGLMLTLSVATSPHWWTARKESSAGSLRWWAAAATLVLTLEILLGVAVRHSGAGLAIPDFPLVFGGWVPPTFTLQTGLSYAHRIGALAAALAVAPLVIRVVRRCSDRSLLLAALSLGGLLGFQLTLGALVVVTGRAVVPNTLHTVAGPVLFAASLALTLHAWRLVRA